MKTEYLQAFFSVVENGSFNQAALASFTSKQSLMKQLDSLENELGFPVIHRSRNGVKLTDAGRTFYYSAKRIYGELMSTVSDCRIKAGTSDVIRIANCPIPFLTLCDPCVEFMKFHPEIIIRIVYHNLTANAPVNGLIEGIYDLCLMGSETDVTAPGISHTIIGKYRLYCLVSPLHPLASRKSIVLTDIVGMKIGLHSFQYKQDVIRDLRKLDPNVDLNEHFGDETEFIFNFCFMGNVYLSAANYATKLYPLRAIPLESDYSDSIALVYRENPQEALKSFVKFVRNYGRNLEGGFWN